MSLPIGSTAIPGWTVIKGELAWGSNSNQFGPKTPSGALFVDLTGYHDGLPYGGLSQSVVTVPGQHYQLSAMVGADQDNHAYSAPVSVAVIAGTITNEFTLTVQSATGSVWMNFTADYVATGSSTRVKITGASTAGGQYIGLDNASFQSASGIELLQNGSFENTGGTFTSDGSGGQSLPVGSTKIPGWTVDQGEIVWVFNGSRYGVQTPYGSGLLDLTGYHDSVPYGGVTQDVATSPGERYQLSFALGTDQDVGAYGGAVAALVTIGAQTNSYRLTPAGTGNQWQTFSFEFQAATATTQIQVIGKSAAGGSYIGLDNVRLVPSNHFAITHPQIADAKLSFDIPAGNFAVETRVDLASGFWEPADMSAGTGTPHADGTLTLTFPIKPEPQRFFRLKQLP